MAMAAPPPPVPPVAPPPSAGGPSYRARPGELLCEPSPPTRLRWRIGRLILWFIDGAARREAWEIERPGREG